MYVYSSIYFYSIKCTSRLRSFLTWTCFVRAINHYNHHWKILRMMVGLEDMFQRENVGFLQKKDLPCDLYLVVTWWDNFSSTLSRAEPLGSSTTPKEWVDLKYKQTICSVSQAKEIVGSTELWWSTGRRLFGRGLFWDTLGGDRSKPVNVHRAFLKILSPRANMWFQGDLECDLDICFVEEYVHIQSFSEHVRNAHKANHFFCFTRISFFWSTWRDFLRDFSASLKCQQNCRNQKSSGIPKGRFCVLISKVYSPKSPSRRFQTL